MKNRFLIFYILLFIYLIFFNISLYQSTGDPLENISLHQNFLRETLRLGEGNRMQTIFPEGYFFTHVLYGLSMVDTAKRSLSSPEKNFALFEVRNELKNINSSEGRAPFRYIRTPEYGIFYSGWRAWLLGGLLSLQDSPDEQEVREFKRECDDIATAFSNSSVSPFLSAYRGAAWPVDSVVAIASLKLHDKLFEPRYEFLIIDWVKRAKSLVDPATSLLPHQVHFKDGSLLIGARGSSQSLLLRFLVEIDPLWANTQYEIFRKQFFHSPFGIPGMREYPSGIFGLGDIDSGPLIFGTSMSASAVTIGTALRYGDTELATALIQTANAVALPFTTNEKRKYLFGFIPVGDAFIIWARGASVLNTDALCPKYFPRIMADDWKVTLTENSLILLFLLPISGYLSAKIRHNRKSQSPLIFENP